MWEILDNVRFVVLLVLFFGASIFVHELGHFLAARWCGLVVEVFSIGFGPSLWKRTYGGVVYKIGCLPLGGYVALPQLDPSGMNRIQGDSTKLSEEEGAEPPVVESLPYVSPWKKIVVSLAGPAGNIALAVPLAWLVYVFGMPTGPADSSGVIGFVAGESAAYEKGLRIGDEIVEVNDVAVKSWTDIRMEVALHNEVTLHVKTSDGKLTTVDLKTEKGTYGEQSLLALDGPSICLVQSVVKGATADKAGLKSGDTIVGFAGQDVFSRAQLIQLVRDHEGQTVDVTVKRTVDGEPQLLNFSMTPAMDPEEKMVRIGIMFNLAAVELDTIKNPKPMEQLRGHAALIFKVLAALTTPKQSKAAASAIGGPVMIFVSYWYIVKTSLMLAIWFTGLLNVNLAILNLLPIPVLDGGHVCFALLEMIRRKPLHPRFVNALVNGFAFALICLIVLLSVRDVNRFLPPVRNYFDRLFPDKSAESVEGTPATNDVVVAPE